MFPLFISLCALSSTFVYAHELDGEWCVDKGNRISWYEQPGGGDAGSDSSNTTTGCFFFKVLKESKDKTGGVAKYMGKMQREEKNAPGIIPHINYDPETYSSHLFGMASFVQMPDKSYTIDFRDIIDANRTGFGYASGDTIRYMLSVQPQDYDTQQGRVMYTSTTKKSHTVPSNFLEAWDALYASSQKRVAKIIK